MIELMVTVAIAAILAVFALPSFTSFIENQSTKTTAQELFLSLMYARSEAIKLNADVYVNATGGDWADGWVVTTVEDKTVADCQSDSTGCLKLQDASASTTIATSAAAIVYQGNGRTTGTPTFTVCNAKGSASVMKRVVSIGLTGQPRIALDGTCAS